MRVTVNGTGTVADNLGFQFLYRCAEFGDAGKNALVRSDGSIQQDRLAGNCGDVTGIVPGDFQLAQILAIGVSLNDRGLHASRIGHHDRVGAFGAVGSVGQQSVRVATDDKVDARNRSRNFHVARKTHMCDGNDLVDAGGFKCLDRTLEVVFGLNEAHASTRG